MVLDRHNLLQITPQGDVEVNGIEQPTGKLHAYMAGSGRLVVKVPGHSYWSGRGSQGYSGAEFQVYEIMQRLDDYKASSLFKCRHLFDFPVVVKTPGASENACHLLRNWKSEEQA